MEMTFCSRCGNQIEDGQVCTCAAKQTAPKKSAKFDDALKIFENEVVPCEGEEKIKAYRISELLSRGWFFQKAVATGILTVTNKRVIFRTECIGKNEDFIHTEIPIEDISGISIKRGKYQTLNLKMILAVILISPACFLFSMEETLWGILYMAFLVLLLLAVCYVKNHTISGEGVKEILKAFLDFTRPLVSVKVNSKGASQAGLEVTTSVKGKGKDMSLENAPLEDLQLVSSELGAIISDIQKNGFYSGS